MVADLSHRVSDTNNLRLIDWLDIAVHTVVIIANTAKPFIDTNVVSC